VRAAVQSPIASQNMFWLGSEVRRAPIGLASGLALALALAVRPPVTCCLEICFTQRVNLCVPRPEGVRTAHA
jgi:hypothetical protein